MHTRFLCCAFITAACGVSPTPPSVTVRPSLRPLPALTNAVPLTADRRLVPSHPRGPDLGDPAIYANLPAYEDAGYGELVVQPGEPHVGYTLDGSTVPALGRNPVSLLRFAHLGDLQIGDDEAPTRVGFLESPEVLNAALRPQDAYHCRIANAAVRTLNGLHRQLPLAFVLVGGDVIDSALDNESTWALAILGGAPQVECDSGDDDDLVPGPDNDPKDPFAAAGLTMPWKWVTGNHDVLIQGNLPVTDTQRAIAIGNDSPLGTRDYSQGGTVVHGPLVADPRRMPLTGSELLAKVAAQGDGHGIGAQQVERGKANYFFDVPGTPLRFIVLDTNAETGGGDALVLQRDLQAFVRPSFDAARREGRWVILVSDHAVAELSETGGPLGTRQPDAISNTDWQRLLGSYDNILFSIIPGYTSGARAFLPATGHGHWEVQNGAMGEYPVGLRLLEVWDGDNGYVLLRATCVDLVTDGDPIAEEGRRRAVIDTTSTWMPDPTTPGSNCNVDLWVRKP